MIQIVPAESSIALHLNQPINQCSEAGIKKGVSFGKFLQRPDTNRFDKHVSWIKINCYKQDWKSEREIISITAQRRNHGHNYSHPHTWQVAVPIPLYMLFVETKGHRESEHFETGKDENFKATLWFEH
mgnify:FL=1